MVQTPNRILTLEEFLALPETQLYCEYIDGKIIPKPMPQGKYIAFPNHMRYVIAPSSQAGRGSGGGVLVSHSTENRYSTIQGELCPAINSVVKVQKMGWAFPELRCTFAGCSIVPDVAVFSWARLPVDENDDIANTFAAAPDWIIEILSPEQSHTKVTKKILHALNHGTQMGWLIDPDERFIAAYPAGQQPLPFEEIESILPVPEFCQGLQLTVGDIFGWLKVTA